jgi:hypothetical protein
LNAEEAKDVLLEMRRRANKEGSSEFLRRTGLDREIFLRGAKATGDDPAAVARDIQAGFVLAEVLRDR